MIFGRDLVIMIVNQSNWYLGWLSEHINHRLQRTRSTHDNLHDGSCSHDNQQFTWQPAWWVLFTWQPAWWVVLTWQPAWWVLFTWQPAWWVVFTWQPAWWVLFTWQPAVYMTTCMMCRVHMTVTHCESQHNMFHHNWGKTQLIFTVLSTLSKRASWCTCNALPCHLVKAEDSAQSSLQTSSHVCNVDYFYQCKRNPPFETSWFNANLFTDSDWIWFTSET